MNHSQVSDFDLFLIGEGKHENLWKILGAKVIRGAGGALEGVNFTVWAPNAKSVSLICDSNGWNKDSHPMHRISDNGIWQLFYPAISAGEKYKFAIEGADGRWVDHADPMARATQTPPNTASIVEESHYVFTDSEWINKRSKAQLWKEPISIYEMHFGSWKPGFTYRSIVPELISYIHTTGFTHVEFLPLTEHPFGGSWGYQVTSFFAPSSRFGTVDDFKYMVNELHRADIGVIMDWVPAHFPKDEWALARFDGTALYEHEDPRKGEHPDWGTLIFNYERHEVKNFLIASALYWLEEMHIDGIRVDAVASMLYLDYSRKEGEWVPNNDGGRENVGAINFLRDLNSTVYRRVPGCMMIAEESTAWPGVTRSVENGGLGFGFKWNMGWMHDTLEYFKRDSIYRGYHHNEISFSLNYAFSENYVLPLSHDEVVHGKGSLINRMPGDRWQELANLRALYSYMWAHPGKKLLFMGDEFAQSEEWTESHGLDFHLLEFDEHRQMLALVSQLNDCYKNTPALFSRDNDAAGFQWLRGDDADSNVLSFTRWDEAGNALVNISNFSPTPHERYRLPLPCEGRWKIVLNTDAPEFGGSTHPVADVEAVEGEYYGCKYSALISLPPLASLWLIQG